MLSRIGMTLMVLITATGCNSIRTTFLKTNECGELKKEPFVHRQGVPVMVDVPSHIEVSIFQTDYWKIDTKDQSLEKIADASSRRASIEELKTEKMFLIDPKRPASGTGSFSFKFGSGTKPGSNVLTNVTYKSEDTTLVDSASLITTAISAFATGNPTSDISETEGGKVMKTESKVAYKRFAIDSCTEENIRLFLASHINCSANCSDTNKPENHIGQGQFNHAE